jgi:hypothetical protein
MRRRLLWLAAAGLLAGGGCKGRDETRYVPAAEAARAALEAALDAWCDGRDPPARPGAAAVHLIDTHRRPGQRLVRYRVLGEAPGEGPRCFAVRLTLDGPAEEVRARYVVLGIDPLWVYRHEDFLMMIHWECHPDEEAPESRPAPPASPKP